MDYLSHLTLNHASKPLHDVVVLNSVTNLVKAVPFIASHEQVYAYLDNDEAGGKATAELQAVCRNFLRPLRPLSVAQRLNDYLRSCCPVKECRHSRGRKL